MSDTNTWPGKWGFLSDLRKCVGKTIEAVDSIKMPYGCTWDSAWAIRFTDGTRAFFAGTVGTGIMSPTAEEIKGSTIFTPEEYGLMAANEKRQAEHAKKQSVEQKMREFEQLKRELGK